MLKKLVVALLLAALPCGAYAQDAHESLAHQLIPHTATLLLLGAVPALMPFDARISHAFDQSGPQHSNFLHSSASAFNELGEPGTVLIAAGALGAGLITGSKNVTDFGLHASEAIAVSGTLTWALKGMAGRLRPNASPGDADEFKLGGGFTGKGGASFPSGHTTAAFALAATLSEEVKLHDAHAARLVTPLAYGAATMVGLARVYSQKHWASDVVLGAVIGTSTAKAIVHLQHRPSPSER